jgi:hypothetical protein
MTRRRATRAMRELCLQSRVVLGTLLEPLRHGIETITQYLM